VRLSALRVAQKRCGEAVPLSLEALSITRQFLLGATTGVVQVETTRGTTLTSNLIFTVP
jgi:hypothetical protein